MSIARITTGGQRSFRPLLNNVKDNRLISLLIDSDSSSDTQIQVFDSLLALIFPTSSPTATSPTPIPYRRLTHIYPQFTRQLHIQSWQLLNARSV